MHSLRGARRFGSWPPWLAGAVCSLAAAPCWAQVSYDAIRTELFEQTNAWRQSQGAAVLVRDRRIDEIIQRHVEDKAACGIGYNGGAHASCDGRTLQQRVTGLSGRFTENMLAGGPGRARDRIVGAAELGTRGGSVSDCSTGSLTGLASGAFVCRQGANVIEPGFIDRWARSPGHRANMMDAAVSFAGIGYAEGIIDAGGSCTSSRDASGHIADQAGCNTGVLAGQMFGSMSVANGFYSTASQMSSLYRLAAAPPPSPGTSPGTPPPPVTIPPLTQPPAVTQPPGGETAAPAMHPNMRQVDTAVADLYRLYGLYSYVAAQRDAGVELSAMEQNTINQRLRESGYGDLRHTDLAANPQALDVLGPYFLFLGANVVDTFTSYLLSDDDTDLNRAVAEIERVMQETAPGQYDAPVAGAVLLDLSMTGVVAKRLAGVRGSLVGGPAARGAAGLAAGQAPGGQPPLLAAAREGDDPAELMGLGAFLADSVFTESRSGSRRDREFWARGYSSRGTQDAENVMPGFDHRQNSGLLGIDFPVGRQFRLGAYVGIGRLDVDFDGDRGDGKTDHYSTGFYGSWFGGRDRRVYMDTVLSVNYLDHDYRRRILLGSQTSEARSNYGSWMIGGHFTTGMLFNLNALAVDPSLSVYYNYQRSDDYLERGDSPLRMRVRSRNIRTWGLRGGVRFSRAFRIANSVLRSRAGFHYLFEDPLDRRDISARFAIVPGNGGNPLVLQGRDHDRSSYQQELGFDLEVGRNMRLGGDYRLTKRSDLEDHLFSVGLRYLF